MNKKELHANLHPFLKCRDYLVSKKLYSVQLNKQYEMLVTFPVPNNLQLYYKSTSYISHTNNKKSLFDKMYQFVRKYTLYQKVKLLNSFQSEEKKVLDVGAGTGDFLSVCKKNNWQVFGVEPNKNARKVALSKKINLKKSIVEFKNQQFDVITLWHVLEHIPNVFEYTIQLKKMLKPNGVLLIAVPNYKSLDANYYKEFWAAYDVPRHLWHFSKFSISKIFKCVDMNISKILPMKFDAYYISLLSEKHKTGKINIIKAFWMGLCSNLNARKTLEYSSLIYILKNK